MGKKPFIDRKKAKHFQVVHRSQRDPLINDNEAPSRVLVEVISPNLKRKDKKIADFDDDHEQRNQKEIESRVGQAALYGVYFDDIEYDYLQHLKPIGVGEGDAVFIEASKKKVEKKKGGNIELKKDIEDNKNVSKKDRKVKILLPEVVLPSKEELPVGILNQSAIPEDIKGFQPDMDPKLREILKALDDDAYVKNDLDDDFFAALNAEDDELYEEGEGEEEDEEDEGEDEAENWELEFKKFRKNKNRIKESEEDYDYEDEDDKGSRTTGGYSMTSSVMFRNDKLRLLDEQFEKISKEYAEDEDTESDDESTSSSQIRQDFSQILDEFIDKYEISGRKVVQKLEGDNAQDKLETIRQGLGKIDIHDDKSCRNETIKEETGLNDENDSSKVYNKEIFAYVESEEKDKKQIWDCQSILSTYSNFENHPTLIREKPRQKISIDRKTGLPSIENKNEENVKLKNNKQNIEDDKEIEIEEDEKGQIRVNLGASRSKNESKEEKKLRKQNIKAERKNRRIDKKSLKRAFAKERTKQNKISHDLSKHLVCAIHLD